MRGVWGLLPIPSDSLGYLILRSLFPPGMDSSYNRANRNNGTIRKTPLYNRSEPSAIGTQKESCSFLGGWRRPHRGLVTFQSWRRPRLCLDYISATANHYYKKNKSQSHDLSVDVPAVHRRPSVLLLHYSVTCALSLLLSKLLFSQLSLS